MNDVSKKKIVSFFSLPLGERPRVRAFFSPHPAPLPKGEGIKWKRKQLNTFIVQSFFPHSTFSCHPGIRSPHCHPGIPEGCPGTSCKKGTWLKNSGVKSKFDFLRGWVSDILSEFRDDRRFLKFGNCLSTLSSRPKGQLKIIILTLLLPLTSHAMTVTVSSGNAGKGLVGHWELSESAEKVGANLITNKTFETDITNWSNLGTLATFERNTTTPIAGTGDLHWVGNASAYSGIASNGMSFITGKTYKVSFTYRLSSGQNPRVKMGKSASPTSSALGGTAEEYISSSTNVVYSQTFTPTETATAYVIVFDASSGASNFYIDNVTITELHAGDSTPSDNEGTIYGASYTTDRHGQANKAMDFDGTDDYIATTLNVAGQTGLTAAGWFYKTDSDITTVFGSYTTASDFSFDVDLDPDGSVEFNMKGENLARVDLNTSGGFVSLNTWHHVAATWNGEMMRVYVDGVEIGSKANVDTSLEQTVTLPVVLGSYRAAGHQNFGGKMADVRIYDRALSLGEIKKLYEGSGSGMSTGNTNKGLVGHWPLTTESEKVGDDLIGTLDFTSGWSNTGFETVTANALTSDGGDQAYARKQLSATSAASWKVRVVGTSTTAWEIQDYDDSAYIRYYPSGSFDDTFVMNLAAGDEPIEAQITTGNSGTVTFTTFEVRPVTAADATPADNHGTIYGADIRNHGYSFDGDDDAISVPYTATLEPTTAITVSAWVKFDNTTSNVRVAGKTEGGGYVLGSTIDGYTDRNFYVYRNGAYANVGWSNTNYSTNTWYHFVGTYDGRYMKFYVDGDLKDTDDAGATYPIYYAAENEFCIGTEASSPSCGMTADFDGNIADVRVYDRALTATEVTSLYQGADIQTTVAHWPLASGAGDISGNDNHGTVTGAVLEGEAMDVKGGAKRLDVGNDPAINPTGEEVSVSMWVKSSTAGLSGNGIMIAKGTSQSTSPFAMKMNNPAHPTFYVYNGSSSYSTGEGITIVADTWYHFVGTYNGTNIKSYLNGVQQASESASGNLYNSSDDLTIGGDPDSSYFDGLISDVRIYDRTLTASDITQLYSEGHFAQKKASTTSLNKGLVGHWPMTSEGEKVGTTLASDGGFESGTDSWAVTVNAGSPPTISQSTDYAYAGTNSLKTIQQGGEYGRSYKSFTTVAGKTYRYRFATYKPSSGQDVDYEVRVSTTNSGLEFGRHIITSRDAWVVSEGTLTADDTSTFIVLYPHNNVAGDDTAYIDDVSMKEVTAADTTPNNNSGTIYGADIRNHGYDFDGTDDYVALPASSSFISGSAGTISAWVKSEATYNAGARIMTIHKGATAGSGFNIVIDSDKWSSYTHNGSSGAYLDSGVSVDTNWHLITATNDGTTHTIYVDGIAKNTQALATTAGSFPAAIGSYEGTSYMWKGLISDALVYDRALSATEVANLYLGADIASPVGHWPLDNGPGDVSGNGNNGTVTGATLVGESADFDGVDDYIKKTGIATSPIVSATGTYSYWARFDVKDTNHGLIHWWDDGGDAYADYIRNYVSTVNNFDLVIEDEDVAKVNVSYDLDNLGSYIGQWYHFVWRQDGGGVDLFINGEEKTLLESTQSGSWWTAHLTEGTNSMKFGNAGYPLDGNMSDVNIWNRALSLKEIQQLYELGR
jgi:hypothetical protein